MLYDALIIAGFIVAWLLLAPCSSISQAYRIAPGPWTWESTSAV